MSEVSRDENMRGTSDGIGSQAQFLESELDTEFVVETFIEAIKDDDLKVVKEVVESGAIDINKDCIDELPGLHWACIKNRFSIAKFLIRRGANVNQTAGPERATALHWAARYGHVYIVDLLLKHGANPTLIDGKA